MELEAERDNVIEKIIVIFKRLIIGIVIILIIFIISGTRNLQR